MSVGKPLRVLQITVRADVGGGPRHVADLLKALKSRNDVLCFTAAPDAQDFSATFREDSCGFFAIPFRKFSLSAFLKLHQFAKSNQVDLIHSHGKGAGIYSRLLGIISGLRVVHSFHGLHPPVNFTDQIYLILERIFQSVTRQYICVSNSERNNAEEVYHLATYRLTLVRNGVDPELFRDGKPSYRAHFGGGTQVYGILSRLEENPKNISRILRALAKVETRWALLIAGDGPDRSFYESLSVKLGIQNRIRFLGNISDLSNFFASIDAYISLSTKEGNPYAPMEATAAGVPVLILSDIPAHRELQIRGVHWVDLDAHDNPEDFSIKEAEHTANPFRTSRAMADEVLEVYRAL